MELAKPAHLRTRAPAITPRLLTHVAAELDALACPAVETIIGQRVHWFLVRFAVHPNDLYDPALAIEDDCA
jgi:hypothetical protein